MAFLSRYIISDMHFPSAGIPIIVILLSIWMAGKVVYRLFFHPLAKFPGPKLAALTVYFEFYHDGVRGGQYTFEIAKMHEKYGMYLKTPYYYATLYDPPAAYVISATALQYQRLSL